MSINSSRLFQIFKYAVYALLAFNVYVFWAEESLATSVQYSGGLSPADIINAYAATIDTAAWVVLLLMFELETYVLEDHQFKPATTITLQAVRVFCYSFIVYAFYGYVVNLADIYQATPLVDVSGVCSLVADGWSYAVDLDEYMLLTAENCAGFTESSSLHRFAGVAAVVDTNGLTAIRHLAWVDVINAAVWLLVVVVLEVDVWLQERNRFEGSVLRISNATKLVLYSTLLLAAIFWGFKGDFVDFWDAFLWLGAFVFIELNVFEWRQEVKELALQSESGATS